MDPGSENAHTSPLARLSNTELPGLREPSGVGASHGGHGISEILDVVSRLSVAGIPSCVVGVRALRYYGAAREWDLCVPDGRLEEARLAFLESAKYTAAPPPPPVPKSLRHTFPCFRLEGIMFYFILVPSSDSFVDPTLPNTVERSRNGVPYASLAQFARSLLVQQLWADVADLIDGMNLDTDWGFHDINLETLQQESRMFAELRNGHLKSHGCEGALYPQDMERIWRQLASNEAKEQRIEPLKKGRYFTRWRSIKFPEDPRTKDRPV
ncbi:hypothetical protein C8A00DRAFT_16113 [Chaetomidium leptoderma]|uniref:Uncharacterized protein n=1 Tax=Chaetomidium leptoderma TaxID=669021 RepID=A0AAN6ZWD1_9PEZI|nr:hypothetical protein C8A00DRAFT_16113 [Chaetomidium leptoderma]